MRYGLLITSLLTASLLACGSSNSGDFDSSSSLSHISVSSSVSSSSSSLSSPSVNNGLSSPEGFGRDVTGGQGGLSVTVGTGAELNAAICDRVTVSTPLVIYVDGTINHGNTSKKSGRCDTKDTEIQLKGVSNISIVGIDDKAVFDQIGIHIRSASNIILQNLHIKNVKKSGSPISNGGDAIGMESNVNNVWVDHCELEASGGESEGYDSLIDMKAGVTNVTVSYNYLHDSGRGGLIGSSDSDDSNTNITFHHNWYQNIDSRTPLLRFGLAHSYNNYFNGISKSGMNPRIGGRIKAEHNYFENAVNPLGTFYTREMGFWDVTDNYFDSVTVAWKRSSDEIPAGPNPSDSITINIPYQYVLDPVSETKIIAMTKAGVNKI